MLSPRPDRRNVGKYCGESIQLDAFQSSLIELADQHRWGRCAYGSSAGHELCYLRKTTSPPRKRVYVSGGIHGDEPAGPLALLDLLRRNEWPAATEIFLFPCLNPVGCRAGTRENADGIDLNRDYRHLRAAETRAHIRVLESLPSFDLMICLHEDWEAEGFYLYELNPDGRPLQAEAVIANVEKHCPIDRSDVIDGRPARNGVIRPDLDPGLRPGWPESFYLIQEKTRWSYTLEAPSELNLGARVRALTAAVECLVDGV